MLPDLFEVERVLAFQRLNVFSIVAALGWPAATAAFALSMASTDFILPPGVVLPQPDRAERSLVKPSAIRVHVLLN